MNRCLEYIREVAAQSHRLTVEEMLEPKREEHRVWPRFAGMWLSRELTDCSWVEIAAAFGSRHRKTAQNGVAQIKDRMSVDGPFRDKMEVLREAAQARFAGDHRPMFMPDFTMDQP